MSEFTPTTAKEAKEYLAKYPDDAKITIIVWGEDDVRMMNRDSDFNSEGDEEFTGTPLTDTQVTKALHDMNYYHDAEQGINWDVIEHYVEQAKTANQSNLNNRVC